MSNHMTLSVQTSSESNEWYTPQHIFDKLNSIYNFTLDPCATDSNAKCASYFTIDDDGLKQEWGQEIVFCNPPYGRDLYNWVEKCYKSYCEGATVVLLIPSRTDTKYFHDFIMNKGVIQFIKGRLKFGGAKHSAPFASMLVHYNKDYKPTEFFNFGNKL